MRYATTAGPAVSDEPVCTERCWTPKPCPDHGDDMNPFGRSAGDYAHYCCENYAKSEINPRHLWNEHDSTRWYTDPVGWTLHTQLCVRDDCVRS